MPVEIYTKNKVDDSDYDPQIAEIHERLEIYVQQIRNLFSAEPGSILGDAGVGIGLESLIYEKNLSTDNLKSIILENIFQYASMNKYFKTDLDIKFAEGTVRDIVFIDLHIDDRKRLELRVS